MNKKQNKCNWLVTYADGRKRLVTAENSQLACELAGDEEDIRDCHAYNYGVKTGYDEHNQFQSLSRGK